MFTVLCVIVVLFCLVRAVQTRNNVIQHRRAIRIRLLSIGKDN